MSGRNILAANRPEAGHQNISSRRRMHRPQNHFFADDVHRNRLPGRGLPFLMSDGPSSVYYATGVPIPHFGSAKNSSISSAMSYVRRN